ncbi:sensor histidine kinase [Paenibacillus sp. 1P07SE]|uniref:sensor histidine kinase n=1 Tax=Paenibacillus sp. 1P07SE TaxID=3132209 RepID=UPI0039A47FE3
MWKKGSFSSRIMLHMALIIMFTFLVSGYISYRITVNLFSEVVSNQFSKANEQAAARIDLQIRDIYRISNFIVFNPYVEQVLRRSAETDERESHTQISNQDELNKMLYQVKNDENKFYSMFLYDNKDNSFFFHFSAVARSSLRQEVYEEVKMRLADSSGNLVWFPIALQSSVEDSGYRHFFVAARYMKNKDFDQYGTMVMLFDRSLFSEDLGELVSDEKANVFLYDRQDSLVYTDQQDQDPSRIPDPAELGAQEIVQENGISYLYAKSRSREMGFSLVSRVALDSIQEKSSVVLKISTAVGAVGVLLAVLLLYWSGKRLFKPLSMLVHGMKRMRGGNLETRVAIDTSDELAYIGQSFNSMAENVNTLVREVYERQLNEREAELTALQTQLNPHFLHNTLDTIYWQLYLKDEMETAKLVVSLSDMLRYALEPADTETLLSDELAQIRNYLTIQSSRHGEELETIIQMGPGAEQAKVPRLILQPLVENVFVHAFADKLTSRVLIIHASIDREFKLESASGERHGVLRIDIIDNGKGMDEKEMSDIVASAMAPRATEGPVVGRKRTPIGIRSVIRRLNLIYGEPYGLKMESKPGAGTKIRLLLPIEQGEESV